MSAEDPTQEIQPESRVQYRNKKGEIIFGTFKEANGFVALVLWDDGKKRVRPRCEKLTLVS